MTQYRELYDYTYTSAPNIQMYPNLNPGRNRYAPDMAWGTVTADLGIIAAATNYGLTRVKQSDSFDVTATTLKILVPGTYRIVLQVFVDVGAATGNVRIYESGLGPTALRASGPVAADSSIRIETIFHDLSITPAAPAIINFQATIQNANAAGDQTFWMIERIGELEAI